MMLLPRFIINSETNKQKVCYGIRKILDTGSSWSAPFRQGWDCLCHRLVEQSSLLNVIIAPKKEFTKWYVVFMWHCIIIGIEWSRIEDKKGSWSLLSFERKHSRKEEGKSYLLLEHPRKARILIHLQGRISCGRGQGKDKPEDLVLEDSWKEQ